MPIPLFGAQFPLQTAERRPQIGQHGRVAVISPQGWLVRHMQIGHKLAQTAVEPLGFDPRKNHGQINCAAVLDGDPLRPILNIAQAVPIAISAAAKRVGRKIANGGQHAANQVRIGRVHLGRLVRHMVRQQQPRLLLDEENLANLERQRIAHGHGRRVYPAHPRHHAPNKPLRAKRRPQLAVYIALELAGKLPHRLLHRLANDGVQCLDHVLARFPNLHPQSLAHDRAECFGHLLGVVANLAADQIAEHGREFGYQPLRVGAGLVLQHFQRQLQLAQAQFGEVRLLLQRLGVGLQQPNLPLKLAQLLVGLSLQPFQPGGNTADGLPIPRQQNGLDRLNEGFVAVGGFHGERGELRSTKYEVRKFVLRNSYFVISSTRHSAAG